MKCLRILLYTSLLLKVVYVFVELLGEVERKKLLNVLFLNLLTTLDLDFITS